MKDKHKYT